MTSPASRATPQSGPSENIRAANALPPPDLEAINALNIALQRYEGTVLLVTHDHDLIDEVATRLWVFHEDSIEDFQGPYAEWKGKHN